MMNVHPNMKARINKRMLLEEVRYFQFMHKEIMQEINSNALAVQACEQHMQDLLKQQASMEDMLFCIQLDNLLEKINAYIAMALLNDVSDNELHLKYITRLPTLFFKLHMHKIKILKTITLHNDKFKILYVSPEIGHCHMLEVLDCTGCGLTEIPVEIGNITHLKKLKVGKNDIKTLPDSVGDLKSLEHLDISRNTHLSKLPKEIGGLQELKVFKAHHAKLQTIPKEIGNCYALQELYVDHNQLKALPKEIAQLSLLEVLYVDHNKLTTLPDTLKELNAIKSITVDGNNIAKIPAALVKYCKDTTH